MFRLMSPEEPLSAVVAIATDPEVTSDVLEALSKAGHAVHVATDGTSGVALVREVNPLVTIVQADLPDIDGSEVARRIREFGSTYLILFSEDVEEIDVILALSAGADDYLTLPLRPREVRARVGAMLRRPRFDGSAGTGSSSGSPASSGSAPSPQSASSADGLPTLGGRAAGSGAAAALDTRTRTHVTRRAGVLAHNGLEVVLSSRDVTVDGEPVLLTRSELDLLTVLLESPRRVIGKDELALALWSGAGLSSGRVTDSDRRTIEVHVANLRRKLGENRLGARFIETVRGAGYRLTPAVTN